MLTSHKIPRSVTVVLQGNMKKVLKTCFLSLSIIKFDQKNSFCFKSAAKPLPLWVSNVIHSNEKIASRILPLLWYFYFHLMQHVILECLGFKFPKEAKASVMAKMGMQNR